MPLEQLVHYFNDRFEGEHHSNLRPFILQKGLVSGIFGPIRISSAFAPVRRKRPTPPSISINSSTLAFQ